MQVVLKKLVLLIINIIDIDLFLLVHYKYYYLNQLAAIFLSSEEMISSDLLNM